MGDGRPAETANDHNPPAASPARRGAHWRPSSWPPGGPGGCRACGCPLQRSVRRSRSRGSGRGVSSSARHRHPEPRLAPRRTLHRRCPAAARHRGSYGCLCLWPQPAGAPVAATGAADMPAACRSDAAHRQARGHTHGQLLALADAAARWLAWFLRRSVVLPAAETGAGSGRPSACWGSPVFLLSIEGCRWRTRHAQTSAGNGRWESAHAGLDGPTIPAAIGAPVAAALVWRRVAWARPVVALLCLRLRVSPSSPSPARVHPTPPVSRCW